MKVEDLKFEIVTDCSIISRSIHNPLKRAKAHFQNGYTASVITGYGAYVNENCPYELAVIEDATGDFYCDGFMEGDEVKGYLNTKSLQEYLDKIEALPAYTEI